MSEQVGVKKIGSVSYPDEILVTTVDAELIAVTIAGGSNATYNKGAALIDGTDGLKVAYTNATSVSGEAVGTGDGTTKTFDLANSNVIGDSLVVYIGNDQQRVTLSAGTGTGGVDQIVFDTAPANGVAIKADYDYHASSNGTTGACILVDDVTTTTTGGNVNADGLVSGTVKTSKIKDSAGNAVDKWFKAALGQVRFA